MSSVPSRILVPLATKLQSLDPHRKGWVPAASVEKALADAGCASGEFADTLLLMLKVDAKTGRVGIARLVEEARLSKRKEAGNVDINLPDDSLDSASARETISQRDLVFLAAADLRALFARFDEGELDARGLRHGLVTLGFKETTELNDLLRNAQLGGMSYHSLIQALSSVEDASGNSTALPPQQVSEAYVRPSREATLFSRPNEASESTRVRRGIAPSAARAQPSTGTRGHAHTSRASTFAWQATEAEEARESVGGTARGGVFPQASPSAPESSKPTSFRGMAGQSTRRTTNQSPLRGSQLVRKAQLEADAAARPVAPSPKPVEAPKAARLDTGLLRQQIHAALRKLHGGDMDILEFARRLRELDIDTPAEASRLMDKFRAGGDVPFKDWVRAFEVVCASPAADVVSEPSSDAKREVVNTGILLKSQEEEDPSAGEQRRSSKAFLEHGVPDHGDVLAWSTSASESELKEVEQAARVSRRYAIDTAHRDTPGFSLAPVEEKLPAYVPLVGFAGKAVRRSHGDILTWTGADGQVIEAEPPKINTGRIVHAARATPFYREGDEPVTKQATNLRGSTGADVAIKRRVPFGTERDVRSAFIE